MNFKNSILVLSLFALLITACESKEEKALREFGEEMNKFSKDFNKEMEKAQRDIDREMEKWGN